MHLAHLGRVFDHTAGELQLLQVAASLLNARTNKCRDTPQYPLVIRDRNADVSKPGTEVPKAQALTAFSPSLVFRKAYVQRFTSLPGSENPRATA
jgi:hypothetical protein